MSDVSYLDDGQTPRIPIAAPSDYISLLKPRVMSLVVFTALTGLLLAPVPPHPLIACVALLSIAVGAGASGALNMWYDADIDAIMTRTATRPVPAGRVTPHEALAFGLFVTAQVEGHAHASQSGDMPGAGQVTLLAAAPAVYEENARHFGARADQGAGDAVILDLQFNGFTLNGHVRESAQIY